MKEFVSCRKMKEIDAHTIQEHKIPSLVLMERAACAVVEQLETRKETLKRILCVCGAGNNGGDGIAIARILNGKGYACAIFFLGKREKMTEETRRQMAIAESYQVPVVNNPDWKEYTTIVDAIFGVGLTRAVEGEFARVIEAMNRCKARRVAVDIPSGIHGDTGQVLQKAVQAEETVTFAYAKPGLYLYPGKQFAGHVKTADIGIYRETDTPLEIAVLEKKDLWSWLPARDPGGNKGTFGKILVVASQKNMAGAGYLCASACFATGAGMVKLHTVEENRIIYQTLLPEALVSTQKTVQVDLELLRNDLDWCDVVAVGPGLGTGADSQELLKYLLENNTKPMVLDADALNMISRYPSWMKYLGAHCVVTPHVGEMSRLTGISTEEIKRTAPEQAKKFHERTKTVCVLKDARTWIAGETDTVYLNISGNDGMATAGSGDVLCGTITGMLAAGLEPVKAAALGAFLHGLAGEYASLEKGVRGMLAGDIVHGISQVLKENEDKM
ncbi:MAG TPA: NAD(P)H-hydrate dehydratase [Candidatus Blautia gallistercoris]|uniref:Bifunctional NAD(P)H-hydrate repair enzyme n=1 Tax=Candidatus Blautia gallistercoris TaxID=2838490 RepID=A0A9D1WFT3_9FIRM|nr:NAD(P)H-hydrate dehydratase [Candidatus Blautia gallistercoris]